MAAAPQRSEEMLTGMEEFPPSSEGSAEEVAQVRIAYAKQAEPVGSVPLPAHAKGKRKSAANATPGDQPLLLLDKLGERLANQRKSSAA